MAPPRKTFKEIYIKSYRFVQIRVAEVREVEVFFAAYNTDGKANYVCPYGFFEKMPDAVQRKLDSELVGDTKLGHSVSVIGFDGPVFKYDPVTPIALNELIGLGSTIAKGNIAIAAQRGNEFLARISIDVDPRVNGRDSRGFMLDFSGSAPKDLVGKLIHGSFVALGPPVVSMTPWDIAERRMREMFAGFMSK